MAKLRAALGLLLLLSAQFSTTKLASAYCIFNGGTQPFTFYQQPVSASGYKIALKPGEWGCCGWYNNDCNFNDGACGITGFGVQAGYESVDALTRSIVAKEVFTYLGYALSAPFLLIPGVGEAEFTVEGLVATIANMASKIENILSKLGGLAAATSLEEFAGLVSSGVVKSLQTLVESAVNKGIYQATGVARSSDLAKIAFKALGKGLGQTGQKVAVEEASVTSVDSVAGGSFVSQAKAAYNAGSKAAVDSFKSGSAKLAEDLAARAGMSQSKIDEFKAAINRYIDASDQYYDIQSQLKTIYGQVKQAKQGWDKGANQTKGADSTTESQMGAVSGVDPSYTKYATDASKAYTAGIVSVPNAGFITVDSDNKISWCWKVYSCDGRRDYMADAGTIGGRADLSSKHAGHLFDRNCFYGCLTNGMDAFGDTDTPAYLYRRSLLGPFDHSIADRLGPNGCCDQALTSMQNALQVNVDSLKAKKNFTTANMAILSKAWDTSLDQFKAKAPMCFMSIEAEYLGCFRDASTRVLTTVRGNVASAEACFDHTSKNIAEFPTSSTQPYAASYPYFGIENGKECYNGRAPTPRASPVGSKLPASSCSSKCSKGTPEDPLALKAAVGQNTKEDCGGTWAISMYRRKHTPDFYSASYSYLGCYNDIYRSDGNDYHGWRNDINSPGDAYDIELEKMYPAANHVLPIRPNEMWRANYGSWNWVPSVQHCADLARDYGYPYFGLQVGNECWLGSDLVRAKSLGASSACVSKSCDYNSPSSDPRKASPDSCGNRKKHVMALYAVV